MSRFSLQFSVRRLMVAVAVVALAFPLYRAFQLKQKYSLTSIYHHEQGKYRQLELKNMNLHVDFASYLTPDRVQKLIAAEEARQGWLRKQVDYHAEMKRKYENAAARPWSSIPPDPPEPR